MRPTLWPMTTVLLLLAGCEPATECEESDPLRCEGSTVMQCSDGQWEVREECGAEPCQAPCSRTVCFLFSCGEWTAGACCGDTMMW